MGADARRKGWIVACASTLSFNVGTGLIVVADRSDELLPEVEKKYEYKIINLAVLSTTPKLRRDGADNNALPCVAVGLAPTNADSAAAGNSFGERRRRDGGRGRRRGGVAAAVRKGCLHGDAALTQD